MADASWDNGGQAGSPKAGLPLWGKIAMGCGIAFLIALVTCVGGAAYVANRFKKDPKGFEQKALAMLADNVRPDWEDFRGVVEQLRSPEGCQALYAANPALARTWPTEAAFLEAASRWHKEVVSVPELSPEVMEGSGLRIHRNLGGSVHIRWSPKTGRSITLTFERAHRSGDRGPRRITELEVQ